MTTPLIMLELNELSPSLLDRYIAAGELPNFSRFRDECAVWLTDVDEPDGPLNPWVQWPTVHTGVGFEDHRVFKLGDGASLTQPTVADVVSASGGSVWMLGPMNVVPTGPIRGRWLPDAWNPEDGAIPHDLEPFATFVRANVQEHTNERHRLSAGSHLRFLWFMARHGLSGQTVGATVKQLIGERTGRAHRWQRAALLDRFGWDLFEHLHRRERPTFATYFSNTTAHYQHVYWRYMDPEPFELKPTPEELERFGDAVPSGYREMDRLVKSGMELADRSGATLVFCTALSQQPYLEKEEQGGKRFYRPVDIEAFVQSLGIAGVIKVAPVMSEQFHLLFADEDAAAQAEATLSSATVQGEGAFETRRVGADVFSGFAITKDLPDGALLEVPATGATVCVSEALYRAETPKSGYHHPSGCLWIRGKGLPAGEKDQAVSLRAVAPTLLALMGIEPPATMTTPPVTEVADAMGP